MERFSPHQKLTHTDALCGADPHPDPHAEIRGKSTGEEVRFPLRCFYHFQRLHHLRHKAAHGLRGFVLLLAGGVGVGAECESSIVVARHALSADLSCNKKFPGSKFEPGNFFVESITRALSLPAIDRYGVIGKT